MEIEKLLKSKKEQILTIAHKNGAYDVRVFGSVARGEARPDSDIDFLMNLESGRSLLDLARLSR
ncbi:MAG TPA: nucleotidyltransferase domain-containing protein [Anaerolineales bacterium]|nr:nucleotidyltransferase domain-containing protein [Anaerolineales bacterium]